MFIVIGLITGVVGLIASGVLATLCTSWYRVSSFEGRAGFFQVTVALIGGVLGIVVGVIAASFVGGPPEATFIERLGVATASVIILAVLVGLVCRFLADIRPTIDGKSLELKVEVRAPRSFTIDFQRDEYGARFHLATASGRNESNANIDVDTARCVAGQLVFSGSLDLCTSSRGKRLRAYFNERNDALFVLPLRSHPREADREWSDWLRAGWGIDQSRPDDEESFWLRYRVVVVEPLPSDRSQAELEAKRAVEEQAAFEAIPADAPIAVWLPYTQYGTPEARLRVAIENIQAREDLAVELGPLMSGEDDQQASIALRMVRHLVVFDPGLVGQVAAAGQKIAAMIRAFNETSMKQDPRMLRAAAVSLRFSGWMEAVRTLREHAGGDFTRELGMILELSRVREDSDCVRMDVRRVASYYMKKWAGLEPLPGDPKPR